MRLDVFAYTAILYEYIFEEVQPYLMGYPAMSTNTKSKEKYLFIHLIYINLMSYVWSIC